MADSCVLQAMARAGGTRAMICGAECANSSIRMRFQSLASCIDFRSCRVSDTLAVQYNVYCTRSGASRTRLFLEKVAT